MKEVFRMKVTVFNGSPSGADSATNKIASAFLCGAKNAGADTYNIFLSEKNIVQCKGCFACWFKTPGRCVCNDDMAELLKLYCTSDIVVFATPVYTWNMTALMKNFVDRLAPLKSPKITVENGSCDLEDIKPKTQKFIVISNCGFPGENNFEVMKAVFACCEPSLEIYRNCGKLLKSQGPAAEKVGEYLEAVKQAGFEFTRGLDVSEKTEKQLEMQLMSIDEYVKYLGM